MDDKGEEEWTKNWGRTVEEEKEGLNNYLWKNENKHAQDEVWLNG